MATFTWTGQSTTSPTGDLTVGATDKFGMYGASFNNAIVVGAYNTSTHIENASNTETCSGGPHMNNTMYVSAGNVNINGGGSVALAANVPTNVQCPLKLNFSHGSTVATSAATFWADDGAVSANAPTEVTFQAGEKGDTSWTAAGGSAAGVTLTDQSTATSHDFFIFFSCSPSAAGIKTAFRLQVQLTYQ